MFLILVLIASGTVKACKRDIGHVDIGLRLKGPETLCEENKLIAVCSLLKLNKLFQPKVTHKCSYQTVTFLCSLLLLLSVDIEPNPGPTLIPEVVGNASTIFPCGSCYEPVSWSCKGVECESCFTWYHAVCQNISDSMYDRLGNDSRMGVWTCLTCYNINITSASLASLDSFETPNPFNHLQNSSDLQDTSHSLPVTSTPKQKPNPKPKTKNTNNKIKRSLKVLVINCRSIVDKKQEYENMVTSTNPDIIIGTESWLKPKHFDNEVFDPNLGYTPFRRDRVDRAGGGVFIAVRHNIIAHEATELRTNCEAIWVKVNISESKPLLICS